MVTKQNSSVFFISVEPLKNYLLRVRTVRDDEIYFDFSPFLCKTRFADLKNIELFFSAATDGKSIIFHRLGVMPLIISASEFLGLLSKTSAIPACGGKEVHYEKRN